MYQSQFNHVQFRIYSRYGITVPERDITQIEQAIRRDPNGNQKQGITLLGLQERSMDPVYEVIVRGCRVPIVFNRKRNCIVTCLPRNRSGGVDFVRQVDP